MRALGCIRNAGDWARAVASLPVTGALAERVVLVPRERVAHALRRELARMQRADVLAGTRFVGPLTAAEEVLREAASPLVAGEEGLRPLRLRRLFATADLELEHFELDQLRGPAGWDEAIARTLGELEAAGRSPDDLGGDARSRDLARLWRTVNDAAGPSVTDAGVYAEATRVLEADPTRWPFG
ncbi:MAG: PD-(D/E)XK nuclease family protein, partial [Myxococcota bacterium]